MKYLRFGVFDGCGTGKTATAILGMLSLEEKLKSEGKEVRRAVIVCPNQSKELVWAEGLTGDDKRRYTAKRYSDDEVLVVTADQKKDDAFLEQLKTKKVIILNYEQLTTKVNGGDKTFAEYIAELGTDYLVFDESHRIKNDKATTSRLQREHVLYLWAAAYG